ncbi:MAG: CCA tRNA nucleotidyltransferase [Alphaproteobacteria bacterium]|nr:CCA tRNA nucleotidyltransferase [Alphaproteobacteria bacterium]
MNGFSGKLSLQAWMVAPETAHVMAALLEDGGDARFVGGCVRDALVNRKVLDIDIATKLKPEAVIERLIRHKINYAPTGLKHGTVTAIADGHPFEITTLRRDVATFGRHAEVEFTDDWAADAARRDFTINAMSCTIDGNIFDPCGGVEDLRLGRVRFVGDPATRIHEDVLRILRFFRFYAHFGRGEPDAAALEACAAAAAQIPKLSAERIRQEILKLLDSDRCPAVWRLMLQCGVVAQFLPEAVRVETLENLVRLETGHHDGAIVLRRLAAVLDVTAGEIPRISQSLRLSNGQSAQLLKMIDPGVKVSLTMSDAEARQVVYKLGNDMARNVLLLAAAKAGNKGDLERLYQTATAFRAPRFPLQGQDLLDLGYAPGPEMGKTLEALEAWWIGEDFSPNRAECLQKLQAEFGPKP